MVKKADEDLIIENERLESLFSLRKDKIKDTTQIKFKIVELYTHLQKEAIKNKELRGILLNRAPDIIFKLSFAKAVSFNACEKFLNSIISFLTQCIELNLLTPKIWEALVTNIFQIFTYKNTKNFSRNLVQFCLFALKKEQALAHFKFNMNLLIDFLRKGKNIDKILFTCEKLIFAHDELAESVLAHLVEILIISKNTFYLKAGPQILLKLFHKWRGRGNLLEEKLRALIKDKKGILEEKYNKWAEKEKSKSKYGLQLIKEIEGFSSL